MVHANALSLVVVALAGAVGWALVDYLRGTPEEPKRFGLEQAKAADEYVTDDSQRRAVKGVLLGVLGYENQVAEDVDQETAALAENGDCRNTQVENYQKTIADLQEEIEDLKEQIAARLADNEEGAQEAAALKELARRWS